MCIRDRSYDVQVVNPNAATAVLRGGLAVVLPAGPTDTPEPTATAAPTDFIRPLLVVQSYGCLLYTSRCV